MLLRGGLSQWEKKEKEKGNGEIQVFSFDATTQNSIWLGYVHFFHSTIYVQEM